MGCEGETHFWGFQGWDNKMEGLLCGIWKGSVKVQGWALEGRNSRVIMEETVEVEGRTCWVAYCEWEGGERKCWELGHMSWGAVPTSVPAPVSSTHSSHFLCCISLMNLPSLFCIMDCLLNVRCILNKIINSYHRSFWCPLILLHSQFLERLMVSCCHHLWPSLSEGHLWL